VTEHRGMQIRRQVPVFDAADVDAESAFWAGVFGGRVETHDGWHSVYDADGVHRVDVQLAPFHVPPQWPDGQPQQMHLDLYVDDVAAAHDEVTALGATLLQAADELTDREGFQVYADPAGHPFCLCWA
jgi:predicted enzyme related to lactoylglutathione lyase